MLTGRLVMASPHCWRRDALHTSADQDSGLGTALGYRGFQPAPTPTRSPNWPDPPVSSLHPRTGPPCCSTTLSLPSPGTELSPTPHLKARVHSGGHAAPPAGPPLRAPHPTPPPHSSATDALRQQPHLLRALLPSVKPGMKVGGLVGSA